MIVGEQTHVQNKLIGERTVAGANGPVTTQFHSGLFHNFFSILVVWKKNYETSACAQL